MKGQDYGKLKAAQMVQPFITIEQYGKNTLILSNGRDNLINFSKQ